MQLPDGHDQGTQINDARAALPFSAVLCLTSVGPFFHHVIFPIRLSPAAMCPSHIFFHLLHLSHLSMCPSHIFFHLLHLLHLAMCPPVISLPPYCRGPITSFLCPTFHAVLPVYSLSWSIIPGGCMGGSSRPEGAELAGPFSIPMLQLLKRLVVVRHLLRHNGKARP
jgi:hypothetical protein